MPNKRSPSFENLHVIGIGISTFHLVGFDTDGKIALRKQIKRLVPTREAGESTIERAHCAPR